MSRSRILLPLLPLAFAVALLARPAESAGGTTQNCCNLSITLTTPTVFIGSTSAQVNWSTPAIASNSMVLWGTAAPSWRTVQQISAATLNDVSIVSSRVQWAVDNAGNVLRTLDGWATYSFLTDPGPASLNAISATSDTTAWVLAGTSIYKTTNGGVSWAQASPAAAAGHNLRDIVMRDNAEGVVVGDTGTIIETTDGTAWNCIAGSAVGCPVNSWSAVNLTVVAGYFDTPSAKNYAVGGAAGTVLKGTGSTLAFIQYPPAWTSTVITSIDMAGPDIIWASNAGLEVLVKPSGTSTFTVGSLPDQPGAVVAVSATDAYYGTKLGNIVHVRNGGTVYDPAVTITPPATGVQFIAGGMATPTSITFVGTGGTVVRYAAPYSSLSLDSVDVINHSVLLTGLAPTTTYHYTVVSASTTVATNWRVAESQDQTFSTAAPGVATSVTKTIGTGAGRDFPSFAAWENARDGNLVTRFLLTVTPGTGNFTSGETVAGNGCTGVYVPERASPGNLPTMTLDNFFGSGSPPTCNGGVMTGATSGATATFGSVTARGGTAERGDVYNDSVYTEGVDIDGSFTDATHYLWLTVPAGQRHTGIRSTGARFVPTSASSIRHIWSPTPYTKLHWLEVDGSQLGTASASTSAIGFPYLGNFGEIAYNFIHNTCNSGIEASAFVTGSKIYNNFVLKALQCTGSRAAIEYNGNHNSGDTISIFNNTVYGSAREGIGGANLTNPASILAQNNLVAAGGSGFCDYGSSLCPYGADTNLTFTAGSSNNAATDPTAPGPNSVNIPPASTNGLFKSVITGSEDLHLFKGTAGLVYDLGVNLSSTQGFNDDISLRLRNDVNYFPWDIGASEIDKSPPGPVGSISAVATWTQAQGYGCSVTYTSASDPESGVLRYTLYRDGALITSSPSTGTIGDVGLAAGTTYTYEVRPMNNEGFERPAGSPTATCTTQTATIQLNVSKTTVVTTAGGTGDTLTVTVVGTGGFGGTVNLTNTVPVGSGSFAPASLTIPPNGNASSTWTVTTGAGTPAANTTDTITGTSGSTVANQTVTHQNTDFSLGSVAPASASVAPGSSTSFTFPITMTNSSTLFNYTVTPASAPASGSITYSLNPVTPYTQSGTATRNQTFTVNTTAATTPGTYTITGTVAYHGKTLVTAPFTLTVLNPDFSIAANPTVLNANQGTSVTENGVLTASNAYSDGAIAVSITGLPAGVTATTSTVSLNTASSPKTVPLTLTVPPGQPLGSFTPTIRAQDSTGLVRTTTFTLNIVSPYTVAASPASDSTLQGTTKNFNVVITGSNGFTDTVNTTFASSNPGITVAPATASVSVSSASPSGQAPVTVTVGAAVPAGVYTVTLNAIGATSGVTRTATYTLTVSLAPDFSVVSSPTSRTVEAGQSATYALAFSTAGGYAGAVTLSLSGLPASIPNANYSTNPVNLPGQNSSTIAIPVPYDPATVGGPYNLTLTASDGTKTKTVALTLTVTPDTTPPVILTGPAANSGACPTPTTCTATVTWTTNEGTDATVLYSTDLTFSSTTFVACPTPATCTTTHTLTLSGLSENTLYNYKARSTNPFGLTVTSAPLTFTTGAAPDTVPPTLSFTTPVNGATVLGVITITVSGTENRGITSLTISETGPLHGSGQTIGTFSTPTTGTSQNGTYTTTWDSNDPVRGEPNGPVTLSAIALDAAGNTRSVSITITINNDKTPPVITAGPTVTVTILATTATATISWNTDEPATTSVQYGLERADGTYTYGSWIDNLSLNTAHQVILSNLQLRSRYHYQIRSCDASNNCVF